MTLAGRRKIPRATVTAFVHQCFLQIAETMSNPCASIVKTLRHWVLGRRSAFSWHKKILKVGSDVTTAKTREHQKKSIFFQNDILRNPGHYRKLNHQIIGCGIYLIVLRACHIQTRLKKHWNEFKTDRKFYFHSEMFEKIKKVEKQVVGKQLYSFSCAFISISKGWLAPVKITAETVQMSESLCRSFCVLLLTMRF